MANGIILVWTALTTAAELQIATGGDLWRLSDTPILTLGAVEGRGPDGFGAVAGAVRLSSGAVIVADQMNLDLRLFSGRGRFLNKAGGPGEGPGEFRTIMSMRRCGSDSVVVYDPALSRLSVFGGDLRLARAASVTEHAGPPPYDFFCSSGGGVAYVHRSPAPPAAVGPHRPEVAITVATREGAMVRLGTFTASERYFDGSNDFPRPLGKITSIAMGSDAVYVGTGDFVGAGGLWEVRVYSINGARLGAVRDTASRQRVTADYKRRAIHEAVSRRRRSDQPSVRRLYESLEYPEVLPAFGRLIVDPADHLWVEDSAVPGAEFRTWRIYTRSGARMSTLRAPGGLRLLEAGRDYVLGVRAAELGVEFVDVYRLIKTGA